MALTAYALSDVVHTSGGAVVSGAAVRVVLTDTAKRPAADFFVGSGSQIPIAVSTTTGANGAWSVNLPSNLDGNQDLRYHVVVSTSFGGVPLVDELIQMPQAEATAQAVLAAQQVALATEQAELADADRVQTGLDRVATGEDRGQTGLDRVATGEDAAAASARWDDIRTRYMGALAADPATDPLGDALVAGASYFNSVSLTLRIFDGTQFVPAPGALYERQDYIATEGQTVFNIVHDRVHVYANGALLPETDYTSTGAGTSVTLDTGVPVDTEVVCIGLTEITYAAMPTAIQSAVTRSEAAQASAEASATSINAAGVSVTPTADTIPKAEPDAAYLSRGWIAPTARVPLGAKIILPADFAVPDGWFGTGETLLAQRVIQNWSPLLLYTAGEEGPWYDPSDLSTVFTTAEGSTLAGVGDPVGRIEDKSGNGIHATATLLARPTLRLRASGLYCLEFDGIDDYLETAVITPGTDKCQIFAGIDSLSDASTHYVCAYGDYLAANPGSFQLLRASAPGFFYRGTGTAAASGGQLAGLGGPAYASPFKVAIAATQDIAASTSVLKLNDASVTSTADQGAGNFGNYTLLFGFSPNAGAYFTGDFYGLALRFGPVLSAADIDIAQLFMKSRLGIA